MNQNIELNEQEAELLIWIFNMLEQEDLGMSKTTLAIMEGITKKIVKK